MKALEREEKLREPSFPNYSYPSTSSFRHGRLFNFISYQCGATIRLNGFVSRRISLHKLVPQLIIQHLCFIAIRSTIEESLIRRVPSRGVSLSTAFSSLSFLVFYFLFFFLPLKLLSRNLRNVIFTQMVRLIVSTNV